MRSNIAINPRNVETYKNRKHKLQKSRDLLWPAKNKQHIFKIKQLQLSELVLKLRKKRKKTDKFQGDLSDSNPRTRKGGTILRSIAFSKNFQAMATLFCQQMWETKCLANSREGKLIPRELKLDEIWIDQSKGSLPFSWATLVCPKISSHMLQLVWVATSVGFPTTNITSFRRERERGGFGGIA